MSMTRGEAIAELQACVDAWDRWVPANGSMADKNTQAVKMALSALRTISREQVEKAWTAEWTVDEFGHKCSKCGEYLPDGEDVRKPQFCPECGRAMMDEAVEMVMERLEVLHETAK